MDYNCILKNVEEKLRTVSQNIRKDIENCKTRHDIILLKSKYLGQDSFIKEILGKIKDFSIEGKKKIGKIIQNASNEIENLLDEAEKKIPKKQIDMFLNMPKKSYGIKHIIPQTISEIKSIFLQMGFHFENSPEVETEYRNFTGLNIDEKHPCRDNHQSFFLDNGKILRTQTTNTLTYVLEKYPEDFKFFTIGRTFRRDSDSTHVPMFHQIECGAVYNKAGLQEMFKILKTLLSNFFEIKNPEIRIRPSFFPFTEPSYEIDMRFGNKWLELLGAGLIHPNVFKLANRTPKLGYAFGCGLERFIMIKHKINDVRELYDGNAFVIKKNGEKIC